MKALLHVLLLLLTAGVWGQIDPTDPAEVAGRGSPSGLAERASLDGRGLPGSPRSPDFARTLGEVKSRATPSTGKQVAWTGGAAQRAPVPAKRAGSWIAKCVAEVARTSQPHLRTNGSSDANGARA